jgi:hypothetical protein
MSHPAVQIGWLRLMLTIILFEVVVMVQLKPPGNQNLDNVCL